ncbi:Holliday junction DNA helicase RuvB C-terminal domain-containing protein [Spiroplasma sp. ChiS]|uniref:Holliday junction DNA helicase RuvB C-terminal domain-containing protein n=1 Tax=Spiroplasma sp. ChiS TaxID=2099885 RepID=UPI00139231F2|nr:Holliday junction DNA helicase RuvB C-terminal domain-containing protein [Spiroplasma sp. ChiS]
MLLFYRIYDYLVISSRSIDLAFLTEILTNLKVFQDGLEWNEVNYLKHIYHLFQQKPFSLGTLGQILNESLLTITNNLEPFLLKKGYLLKTPRGGMLTSKTIQFLKNLT